MKDFENRERKKVAMGYYPEEKIYQATEYMMRSKGLKKKDMILNKLVKMKRKTLRGTELEFDESQFTYASLFKNVDLDSIKPFAKLFAKIEENKEGQK